MNKKTKICILITFILLLISLSLCFAIYSLPSDAAIANIYQNGEIIYSIDLDKVNEPYEITITGDNGETNTVYIKPGEIAIIQASCPDKLCVKAGYIHNNTLPITCLPNHVMIRIEQGSSDIDGLAY